MKTLKERILKAFPDLTEEKLFDNTVDISYDIAYVAHEGQYRDNEEPYINHPSRLYLKFSNFISIDNNNFISKEALLLNGIPYLGVPEVCLLHDVVEDSDISHEEIRELFYEYDYGDYFDKYIDIPLRLITHDKSEPYESYIKKIMTNPIASLVKLFDLSDNLNPFGLMHLTDEAAERSKRYIDYFKMINDEHLFLAKIINAKRMDKVYKQNKDNE